MEVFTDGDFIVIVSKNQIITHDFGEEEISLYEDMKFIKNINIEEVSDQIDDILEEAEVIRFNDEVKELDEIPNDITNLLELA